MTVNTTTRQRDSLIQMFLDGTADEVYADGRLVTRETENGVELIAYGWNKIAEYNPQTDTVTLFAGHAGNVSKTVTRYVNVVHEIAGKRESRTVNVIADAAPNVSRPPAEAAQFIDQYVGFGREMSAAEKKAVDTVNRALRRVL